MRDIKTLEIAFKRYYMEYQRWPVPTNHVEMLIESHEVLPIIAGTASPELMQEYNPKQFLFFPPQQQTEASVMVDAWDSEYCVIFDMNYDLAIQVGDATVKKPVVVWSKGKNKINEWGQGDDLSSWDY